ncbi:MAG TPA: carboxypeptidase-like regulatory domain-containing protein [Pedobacter sp.]|jgi:hypothetical protein
MATSASSQSKQFKVEGYLYTSETSNPIANAIFKASSGQSTRSKDNGYFSLNLPFGKNQITITHLTYDTLNIKIEVTGNTQTAYYLNLKSAAMAEVKVSAKKSNANKISPNVSTITNDDLEKVPAFLGQRDPIKALQTLPGTGKGGEGNSGFYVRGATSGQNLTIFNDAVIYNPSHLLGFFSVFNSGAVDHINLYKSGIPSEFGGRLSAIIEVNSSRKIADSISMEGDISILAASASLATPVTKNWSISAIARKTFMNYTVWPLLSSMQSTSSSFNNIKYDFHDLNFSSNARLGKSNFLYFNAYTGDDAFGFDARADISNGMDWQNSAYSLTLKTIISNSVVLNNTASFSGYRFNFGLQQDNFVAGIASNIRDYNFKSIINIYLDKHYLKGGIQYVDHNFKPNTPSIRSFGVDYDFGNPNTYYSDESSIFLSDEYKISDQTGIYAGLRLTNYRHKGPYTLINEDKSEVNFGRKSTVRSFLYLEPSLTFKQSISNNSSIKFSFSRNVQPIHLISVTAVNFPADFWMPSLNTIPAEKGQQFSLGYFRDFGQNYESYIDMYYKKMNGLIEFSGGIMSLIDNLKIENNLSFGNGDAYGTEVFLKKKMGKFTGWIGYTLSKSNRTFELINDGETFPAKYDRRHDLSIVSNYARNRSWSFSGSFTYATGNAYTKPESRYLLGGNIINEYGAFNGSRMPAYHRIDLSLTYKSKLNKRFASELSFSVYNIYNRQNPIYIYFDAEGSLEQQRVTIRPKSVALLPVLPSLSYRLLFKQTK